MSFFAELRVLINIIARMGNRWVGIPPRSQSSQSQRYTSFKKVLFQIEQENLSPCLNAPFFKRETQQHPNKT